MTARRRRGMLSGLALAGAGIVAALGAVSAPAFPGVPPTASITASPNPALVNENVTFDGSGSTGDGLGSSITTYEWDLDGDSTFETSTGNNPTVSRPYPASATITVSLRVTDDDGDTDEDSVSLVVNSPPTAGFIYEPSTPAVNEQITFSSTSSDAEGPIPNTSQRWDFDNDGQFDDATGQTVTRAFSSPGTKPVGLQVTDSDGASATLVRNVVVPPNQPSAAFSFAPQSPLSGEAVTFDGSGSTAPAGQAITAMNWDLDDDGAFDDGSGAYAQTPYSTPGPHTVRGLAQLLGVSKPVITRALNTLGGLGYLRRVRDESDRRNVFVAKTNIGQDFLEGFESNLEQTSTERRSPSENGFILQHG